MASHNPPPFMFPKSHAHPFQHFLNNPGSLFEHKFFTTITVIMRNLTEQIQDYTHYYVHPGDNFYNASVRLIDTEDETEPETHELGSPEQSFLRGLLSFLCILTATYFVNRTLLRRNRLIQYAIEFVACYAIVLPILPFVALFFGTIGVFRLLIWGIIQVRYRGKRFMVSPEDGFWAYEEHGSSSSSVCVYVIEGVCDLEKIKQKVRVACASPVVNGRMHRRLITMFGFAVWEVVEMDPVDHVRVAIREKPGPWTDKDMLDYMSTFQDIPITNGKPAWEVIVIPDMRVQGSNKPHYACVFRMHHAMMDGISSANVLHQVLADKPFKFTIDPVEGKRRGKLVTFATYFMALFMLPRTGIVSGLMNLDNKHNKWFAPGKTLTGPKHFAWSRPFKMDALKKIKDTSKSSVMTVLLSSLGGSYRAMEEGRRWRIGKKAGKLPEFYHALAPVALLPYPDRHPRNGFSGVVLPVCVGEHKSQVDRLRVNHKEFKNLGIGVMDVIGNFLLIGMVGVMPNMLQKIFGCLVHCKMSISNIPGSDEEIFIFGGDRISEMGAFLPLKFTLGMAMGLFSYGGRCRATMVGDSAYFSKSDVESLVANFETEICELGKSLGLSEDEIFY